MVLLAIVLMASGCNNPLAPIAQQFDVRMTIVSHTDGRPISGAWGEVVQTHDGDWTDANGQTDWLLTPRQAQWVDLLASYGQIEKVQRFGLSRDPTRNQPRIALAPGVPTSWALTDDTGNTVADCTVEVREHRN
jgi:hypothetical protein